MLAVIHLLKVMLVELLQTLALVQAAAVLLR
jgi:hypothetical protein